MPNSVAFLEVLGVKVVEVEDLEVEVAFVDDVRVGLVRAGLPARARRRVYDWLIAEADSGSATAL